MLRKTDDGAQVDILANGKTLLGTFGLKEWESRFIGKRFGLLKFDHQKLLSTDKEMLREVLEKITSHADHEEFELVEFTTDVRAIGSIPHFVDFGFRLVDTRITFVTLVDRRTIEPVRSSRWQLRLATIADLPSILEITKGSFVDNPEFCSRFKNRLYFSSAQSDKYFSAWIENHLEADSTLFAVVQEQGRVVGYFFYIDAGEFQGKKLYKGGLTAVLPEFRGNRLHLVMQAFLYEQFPEDVFYLDNTTQLTNYAAVKNHISSNKKLDRIELTYFRAGK